MVESRSKRDIVEKIRAEGRYYTIPQEEIDECKRRINEHMEEFSREYRMKQFQSELEAEHIFINT